MTHGGRRILGSALVILGLTACASDKGDTAPAETSAAEVTTGSTNPVAETPASTATTAPETGVPGIGSSTTVTTPTITTPTADTTESGVDDGWYIYAEAGAEAIAARLNDAGVTELDPAELEAALVEAGEAAYEIEYPSIVVYLDVKVATGPPSVEVVVGDDENPERVSSFVCLDGTKAYTSPGRCTSDE